MSAIVIPKRRLLLVYEHALKIIGPDSVARGYSRTPYVYGGGHGPGFKPTKGLPSQNPRGLTGYDCSGFLSACAKAGGILGETEPENTPLDTEELMGWGEPGAGRVITVHVRNDSAQQHCFLEFHDLPEFKHRYAQAPHTGEFCEWFTPSGAELELFIERHFPGA